MGPSKAEAASTRDGAEKGAWKPAPLRGTVLRRTGGTLLLATGGIHLDLFLTGYRHIPTIGPLFLLQLVAALLLGAASVVIAQPVVALAGAGCAGATLGGYVLSLWTGLFGFHEVRTTSGIAAGALEVLAIVLLGAYAASTAVARGAAALRLVRLGRRALAPLGALAAVALALAVTSARDGGSPGGGGGTGTKVTSAGGAARATGSVHVTISNFAFLPARVRASPGERIVVTNNDGVTHTFTAMPGTTPVGHFTTGDIAPGTTKSVAAPSTPGTYTFYCQIHPFMTGALTVG